MKRTLLWLLFLLLALAVTLGLVRSRAARIGSVISPEIVSFTAIPKVISHGQSATLAWETRGVTSVAMERGPEHHPRGALQKSAGCRRRAR
jgi:hypothetical protein